MSQQAHQRERRRRNLVRKPLKLHKGDICALVDDCSIIVAHIYMTRDFKGEESSEAHSRSWETCPGFRLRHNEET